ncbi:MAG: class I SAM-dependent methyltransferase [Candidatus Krumholzibacteria bacterium]|nr:class I SAM-dependent methyltransferase [Candidatus Krumholzibacteria bacterium]
MAVFDDLYASFDDYFGLEPDDLILQFNRSLDRAGRVLDIGAGQGRNALFLARRGCAVDALEPSAVAVEQMRSRAADDMSSLRIFHGGFETFSPDVECYTGILVFGIIQELPRESIGALMRHINAWTREDSLALVTAFTVEDPGFGDISQAWRAIGKNSFSDDAGFVRTFLELGELRLLFGGWEALHYWEGLGAEHSHGGDAPHRHGRVEAMFRKGPGAASGH